MMEGIKEICEVSNLEDGDKVYYIGRKDGEYYIADGIFQKGKSDLTSHARLLVENEFWLVDIYSVEKVNRNGKTVYEKEYL